MAHHNMNKPEEYLSQSKYAEHRNVTKGYIGRLVKEGRLHLIKGKLNVEMFEVLEKNMAGLEAKPLKKVNKPYKIRREGSFVSGFK